MVTVTPSTVEFDEWGHFVDSAVDEWGNSHSDTVTEFGVAVYSVLYQVTTTDTANAGTDFAFVFTEDGDPVYITDTANAGRVVGDDNTVFGGIASTTEVANVGTPIINIVVEGSSSELTDFALTSGTEYKQVLGATATETSIANTGSAHLDLIVEGAQASTSSTAFAGGLPAETVLPSSVTLDEWASNVTEEVDEWGQRALETGINELAEFVYETVARPVNRDIANAGLAGAQKSGTGSQAATTETANAGAPLVDIVVLGSTATVNDSAFTGGAGVLVFGTATDTLESPSAGEASSPTLGRRATTQAIANAGNVYIEAVGLGGAATTIETPHSGRSTGQLITVVVTARSTGGISYSKV